MHLAGFHHLTAITAAVGENHRFYTQDLGLRLVKKTVNQDDVSAYHLFYGDGQASPGSDITFFDWPVPRERRGTRSVTRTGFRVDSDAALKWWEARFTERQIKHESIVMRDDRLALDFEDTEGQRLTLVVDPPGLESRPWAASPVPAEYQLRGLGPIVLSVSDLRSTEAMLTQLLNMRRVREYGGDGNGQRGLVHVFAMTPASSAGASAATARASASTELHVAVEPHLGVARSGAGGVHHVAFRAPTAEAYEGWAQRLQQFEVPSSGPVNRYYFRSLYFREPNGILFEIATDEPGFAADEPLDKLGEKLALPPFLEPRRAAIEAGLKAI